MPPSHQGPGLQSLILAHFSDIHVSARGSWTASDFFSKRLTGWVNWHWFGRGGRFDKAPRILRALRTDLEENPVDRLVFSGDATALGFQGEFAEAAKLLGLGEAKTPPGLAVPGNHDAYTRKSQKLQLFEKCFSHWQEGLRIGEHTYPFAQAAGPAWIIGVNSSTANVFPWDSRGRVGREQLDRLEKLLNSLAPGPRVLVTHYPAILPSGKGERLHRMLRDWRALVELVGGKISFWLHGHRHDSFLIPPSKNLPFPILCAGSATQKGHGSYFRLTLQGNRLGVERRQFQPELEKFLPVQEFQLEIPVAFAP